METESVKALACRVLERNIERNKAETKQLTDGNFLETYNKESSIATLPFFKWQTASGRIVYLAPNQAVVKRNSKPGDAWFTSKEIGILEGIGKEIVERVIDVKEVFLGSRVERFVSFPLRDSRMGDQR